MKLSTYYAHQASREERALEDLLGEQEVLLERRRRLRALQGSFERMASDGILTEPEIEEILASFYAEGLDTSAIGGFLRELVSPSGAEGGLLVDGVEGSRKRELISSVLRRALDDQRDADDQIGFRLQVHANEYRIAEEAASRLERSGFDADMAVIRNTLA